VSLSADAKAFSGKLESRRRSHESARFADLPVAVERVGAQFMTPNIGMPESNLTQFFRIRDENSHAAELMIRAPQGCSASQSIRLVKESVVSIRAFLLCAFAILALMLVGLAGFSGFRVIQTYRMNESFLDTDATTELLLKAAADLAIERGLSNAPLHAPDPLSAERRTEIERVRANADQVIRDGIGRLRSVPEMANALGAIDDFERSYRDFGAFRQRVDGALRAPGIAPRRRRRQLGTYDRNAR
jgi:hypothetical protein